MIRYAERLYLTKRTEKELSKIKLKLFTGAGMAGVHLILLSENSEEVFDIVHAAMFKQKRYRKRLHTVIGIAESRRAAFKLIEGIIEDHLSVTGSYLGLRKDIEERVIG